MFLIISLILILCYLLYKYLVWHFDHWKLKGIPGPKPKPFVGNFPSALFYNKNILYEFDEIFKKYRAEGYPLVGVYSIRFPMLLAISPKIIKDIFVKKFNHFHDNSFADLTDKNLDPLFGRNPFLLKGNEWKDVRSDLTPAFTSSKLKANYPIIEDVCEKMIKYLNKKCNKGEPLELHEISGSFTTDVVTNCIYGLDAKSFSEDNTERVIHKMGKKMLEIQLTYQATVAELCSYLFQYLRRPLVPKTACDFFIKLMKDAVNLRKESKTHRDDYLEFLINLQEKKGISLVEMAAHGSTFFIDGFETSGVVLGYILLELSLNPDVQDRLRKEIESVYENGTISFENLNEIEYLDQVLYESIRLHSPIPILSKICTESITLEDDECEIGDKFTKKSFNIEKGDVIAIPVYSIHRDPYNFKNPDKFDPERFSSENGGFKAAEDKGILLPFGGGPRVCIGRRFAKLQMKRALVEILTHFELKFNKKTKYPLIADPKEFFFKPIGGLWVDFIPIRK